MNISVFGLGYVGAVTAACLAKKGHRIIGVDLHAAKVAAFNQGISPIVEPGLDALLKDGSTSGKITATQDVAQAVAQSDASIICVGTPSQPSGSLDLSFVLSVTKQLAGALSSLTKKHVIIFRSTMLPGSTRRIVGEVLGDLIQAGRVEIYYCPEFLREGTAVRDFDEPSLSVIGNEDGCSTVPEEIAGLLGGKPELLRWEGAEMIKYSCNYFHALKVGFANEIGRLCKQLGEDGKRVMQVVCEDKKLNISSYYMRPGAPFGGSCLPKDVSALHAFVRQQGLSLPLLENTLSTNASHQQLFVQLIEGKQKRRIGFLGLAFKADTDDLRGSPLVAAAETLYGRGHTLSIFDPQINLSRLIGSNEQQIQQRMPHLAQLMKATAGEVLQNSDVIVISQKCASIDALRADARADHAVIDVNGWEELKSLPWQYDGICW